MIRLEIKPTEAAGEVGLFAEGGDYPLVRFHPPNPQGAELLEEIVGTVNALSERNAFARSRGYEDAVAWEQVRLKDHVRIEFLEVGLDLSKAVGCVTSDQSSEGLGLILAQSGDIGEATVRQAIDVSMAFDKLKCEREETHLDEEKEP